MNRQILQVEDQYYVLATSLLANRETRILKQGETFAIFDVHGDLQPITHAEGGIFHKGTRHLSLFEFVIVGGDRPLLLNSTLRDDNGLLKADLTNRDMEIGGAGFSTKGTLHIHREKFLSHASCLERFTIANYGPRDIVCNSSFRVAADFNDIFEVRGTKREKRGRLHPVFRDENSLLFKYEGLDGIVRTTQMSFSVGDFVFDGETVHFPMAIAQGQKISFEVICTFGQSEYTHPSLDYDTELKAISAEHLHGHARFAYVRSSNPQFDQWLRRSTDDIIMMSTETAEKAPYPYAGIPWYCAAFGRDGIVTALECLWANPEMARGVLSFLAQTQAQEHDPLRDSTPGKIIHEVRLGEMANLKEIPFGRYYGSIDSTPLFLILGGSYLERTNDTASIEYLWPAFEKALFWLDRFGDLDGDGFIEYQRENPNGLIHQGWKDSQDCVFHADGSDAKGPIALAEVQAYTYLARLEAARMADAVGRSEIAAFCRQQARELKERFNEVFWMEDAGAYAMALDGDKKLCRVVSSNSGQCLFTGIVPEQRADRIVQTMMSPENFSGWGIRTIAKGSARYNPISYHNGSVWPHDGALIAWGFSKYGYKDEVDRLFNGLFKAAQYMDIQRMPEVFCGFSRKDGEAPTMYPTACSPQAWAAGSIYLLLQSMLGLKIDAPRGVISFHRPRLPDSIETLRIRDIFVRGESVDLTLHNYHSDVSVEIARRTEKISVIVEK